MILYIHRKDMNYVFQNQVFPVKITIVIKPVKVAQKNKPHRHSFYY